MRQFFLRLPLATKCAAIVAGLCLLSCCLLVVVASRANHVLLQQFADVFATQWGRQLAQQSQAALLNNDRISLQALLQRHIDNPLVIYSAIIDPEGNTLVEAGDTIPSQHNFDTDITLGRDTAGTARLQLDNEVLGNEVSLLAWQLFLLSTVLTGLVAALSYTGGHRLDTWLNRARQRLLQPLADNGLSPYPADDALGQLLTSIHSPTAPQLNSATQDVEWVMLQVRWQSFGRLSQQWGQAELEQQMASSYQRAALLARLYQGVLSIHQTDGLTLRFAEQAGAEPPLFRALCCAHLLPALDRELNPLCRIGLLRKRGNPWQIDAATCSLSATLHSLPGKQEGILLQLPAENKDQLLQWAELDGNCVTGLAERYQQLLDKQIQHLQSLSFG